ncbi:MAG TPA: hypothetical protein VMW27_20120 [Thermoanaerobaculia bacterium]|nr:hypothetical protein [Thermoanaerobaculia bacterium]
MTSTRILLLSLLLLALLPDAVDAVDAGVGRWTPIGPDGGGISALAAAPNGRTLYAGTPAGGVFKSINGGRSWQPASSGLRGWVKDLDVEPAAPRTVYAATSEGLVRSDDAGASWVSLNAVLLPSPQEVIDVSTVAVDPSAPGTVYASPTGGNLVFRSTDHGASWQLAAAGLGARVLDLAVDSQRAGRLFAATLDGVFRSRDGGRTWVRSGLRGSSVSKVTIDPLQPDRLYAVTHVSDNHGIANVQMLWSDDGGRNWRFPRQDVIGFFEANVVADPFSPGTAYTGVAGVYTAGLFKTTDGGRNWLPVEGTGAAPVLVANPARPGVLFAGVGGSGPSAVLKSTDAGASWTPSGAGIRALEMRHVVVDPATPGVLYATTGCCGSQLWKTSDGGGHWQRIESAPRVPQYFALVPDPAAPGTLYLGTNNFLSRSTDGGATWTDLSFVEVKALALAPTGTLYAGFFNDPVTARSQDGGRTWETLEGATGFYTTEIDVAPGSPPVIYANGQIIGPVLDRVRRSEDGGATWTTVLDPQINHGAIEDIVVDPHDPRRVLVAFVEGDRNYQPERGRVYQTTDGGATWSLSRLAPHNPAPLSLAIDPQEPRRVYAGSTDGAVFVSEDGGATWESLSDGLPSADVVDLQTDPFHSGTVYAATVGGSVYALTRPPR